MLFSSGLYLPMGQRPAAAGAGGEQTVLFDASASNTQSTPSSTSYTGSGGSTVNVGSGANGTTNLCLLFGFCFGGANGGTSNFSGGGNGVIWDSGATSQVMTLVPGASLGNGANGGDIFWFYLMNPTLGSKQFIANWTGGNQATIFEISFVNVDQTGGTTSFPVVQTSTASIANIIQSISLSTTPTTRKIVAAFNGVSNYVSTTSQDLGHNNGLNVMAVASCWDAASAGSLNYTAAGQPVSPGIVAFAVKGA